MKPAKAAAILFLLVALPFAGEAAKVAGSVEKRIEREGGKKFIERVFSSPLWDTITDGISSGDRNWLLVGKKLMPFSDAGSSEDLDISFGIAIGNNPIPVFEVLSMGGGDTDFSWYCRSIPIDSTPQADINLFVKRESMLRALNSKKWEKPKHRCLEAVDSTLVYLRNKSDSEE